MTLSLLQSSVDYTKNIVTGIYQQDQSSLKQFGLVFGGIVACTTSLLLYYDAAQKKAMRDENSDIAKGQAWPINYVINVHKIVAPIASLVLFSKMFNRFNARTGLHLGLHATYGLLWVAKDYLYPDKRFSAKQHYLGYAVTVFVSMNVTYCAVPLLFSCANPEDIAPHRVAIAILMWGTGVFVHFGADCQKYFTLKYKKGLITDGFFKLCRHPGYTGELFIYGAFAYVSGHWLSWLSIASFIVPVFQGGLVAKEKSLSRYEEWDAYKQKTMALLPNIFALFT